MYALFLSLLAATQDIQYVCMYIYTYVCTLRKYGDLRTILCTVAKSRRISCRNVYYLKGIVQRDLTRVEARLKKSVLLSYSVGKFSFLNLKGTPS